LTTEAPGAGLLSRLLAFLYAHGRYPPPPVGPVYCDGALGMEYPLQDKILNPLAPASRMVRREATLASPLPPGIALVV